jgi:hypothetical protein
MHRQKLHRAGAPPRTPFPGALASLALALAGCARPAGPDAPAELAAALARDFEAGAGGRLSARAGSGWVDLLADGLAAWEIVGPAEGVSFEGGVLEFTAEGGDGYVRTRADHRDFRLRLDFKIGRMANSGVFLRGARDGTDPAYSGCELQILDDFDWEEVTAKTLEPYQFTGGLYGSLPPAERALLPLGEWNTYAIEYRGTRLAVLLNGRVIHDLDTLDAPGKPFAERAPAGFIGLQRHGPRLLGETPYAWFRNVFVQAL